MKEKTITKSFTNGKIIADIEMTLREKENGQVVFSTSGYVWNGLKKDSKMVCGGQCLDTINEYFPNNKMIASIVELWEKWHLNDMHAGTPKQEQFLKENNLTKWANDYTNICNILKENNLYNDNGYNFGSGWLYQEINKKDLAKIKKIMGLI